MAPSSPNADYTQEVRFAVVMYGGVSLAIYINGIAQELLRLVRSTAPIDEDASHNRIPLAVDKLKGTERVYRRLSYLLADPNLLSDFRKSLDQPAQLPPADDMVDRRMATDPINTRFVVDILSGTSAGGINAIYLAKALANDQQLDELKQLWVTEGDIALLINDKNSTMGLHLTNQEPPQSLLNSRRMYLKLLKALHGMEAAKASKDGFKSPHVDELDLFITTTDIEGIPLPLRLSDTVVYERRHRNVFHFKYATTEATGKYRNDFLAHNDPFMAFAARCTSSFPFAFEPMRLCDIDEVLDLFPIYKNDDTCKSKADRWKKFFGENIDAATGKEVEFADRSFGDGGYLDNKPFTYATETLSRRDAPVLVDRKLIYIEPSPEHPEDEPLRNFKPQALENVKAALLDLPSYETIREDLQRLIERNVLLKRVNRITRLIEGDLDASKTQRPDLKEGEWETLDLADMCAFFGVYYIPYRRLRIASTTDELTKLVARAADLDENSAHFTAIRYLIQAWREINYPDYKPEKTEQAETAVAPVDVPKSARTANQFLGDYDFKYWLRRLTFIRSKVDQLYKLGRLPAFKENGAETDSSKLSDSDRAMLKRLRKQEAYPLDYSSLTGDERRELQRTLTFLKCELNVVYKDLRVAGKRLQSKPSEDELRVAAERLQSEPGSEADSEELKPLSAEELEFFTKMGSIKLGSDLINYLLGMPLRSEGSGEKSKESGQSIDREFSRLDENKCMQRAQELLLLPLPKLRLEDHKYERTPTPLGKDFHAVAEALRKVFEKFVSKPAWERGKALLDPRNPLPDASARCPKPPISPLANSVREYLWHYFSHFDDYDQISFPILFGTDVGESDVVEIIRISPEDATSLINEREESRKQNGRRKLAGTAIHHFGAFLDQVWRQNDILWGRLDGAERLITTMLPNPEDKKVRETLINEAHSSILIDELTPPSRAALTSLLADALVRISSGVPVRTAVAQVINPLRVATERSQLETVMRARLENQELLAFIKSDYAVKRDLDPKLLLRSISRSTQVIGKMFEDMANQHNLEGKRLAWIARLGQVFWGLVEVAVPGSILNLLFFHWLKLLYAFEAFLILGALLLGATKEVRSFGLTALGITVVINLIVLLLGDYMRGRKAWWHAILAIVSVALLFFAAMGISELFGLGWKAWLFSAFGMARAWFASLLR